MVDIIIVYNLDLPKVDDTINNKLNKRICINEVKSNKSKIITVYIDII